MIRLNLLPEKVRSAERLKLIVIVGVGVYAVGLLFLGWGWMRAGAKVDKVKAESAAIEAKLNAPELREAVEAVNQFTKDQNEMKEKASIVNTVRKRQVTLVRLLDQLPDWTQDGTVWVVRLEVKDGRGGREVGLEGHATSPLAFARFFTNLEAQPLVQSLKLTGPPTPVPENGQSVITFTVTFTLAEYQ